jgi:hypothetical protein
MNHPLDYPDHSVYLAVMAKARRDRNDAMAALASRGLRATWNAIGKTWQRLSPLALRGAAATFSSFVVALGMGLLAVYSFSGNAVEHSKAATAAMTGATLSTLHASIPAETEPAQPSPTF